MSRPTLPRIALTFGDVAGIGPEVIARAVAGTELYEWCRPLVTGHPAVLERALRLVGSRQLVREVDGPAAAFADDSETAPGEPASRPVACWNPSSADTESVSPGAVDARAGLAAAEWLTAAARAALAGEIDAVTTAPLNKMALREAGIRHPGHTEILAETCGTDRFAMMLYLPSGEVVRSPRGLGVAHVTLHTSIASVPGLLNCGAIEEKIALVHGFLEGVGCPQPRVAVCALNPHAGEEGLFGDEEARLIAPAVAAAQSSGIRVEGPFPADTLLGRAVGGEYDGVVAMYHDQGHIALKLIGFNRAVNVTLGLPIVRTSPSHGTAFDIAWQGQADHAGLLEAVRVAAALAGTGSPGFGE